MTRPTCVGIRAWQATQTQCLGLGEGAGILPVTITLLPPPPSHSTGWCDILRVHVCHAHMSCVALLHGHFCPDQSPQTFSQKSQTSAAPSCSPPPQLMREHPTGTRALALEALSSTQGRDGVREPGLPRRAPPSSTALCLENSKLSLRAPRGNGDSLLYSPTCPNPPCGMSLWTHSCTPHPPQPAGDKGTGSGKFQLGGRGGKYKSRNSPPFCSLPLSMPPGPQKAETP